MTQKIIYLAGPIFGCVDEECDDWRQFVKIELSGKYRFLDPMRNDYRGQNISSLETAKRIVDGDKHDILSSDVLLANCYKPSVGTSMEILLAWEALIPRVVIIPTFPNVSPWLVYHATIIFSSIGQATDYLRKLP